MISPAAIDLGGCEVRVISGGGLKLDGGAMFGIIPKVLWSRVCPADEQNRIQLGCNCLLVDFAGPAGRRAIVETGHGEKFGAKECGIYAIDPARWLLPTLTEAGVDAETITDVVLSHLHFDHAGGLTRYESGVADAGAEKRRILPTFPAARVHVQRREFDDARANFGIMTMTYREENFRAIDELSAWELADGEVELVGSGGKPPRIRAIQTPGHTRGHHSVFIEGRDRAMLFTGDVMPTRHHVGAPYNMGYDVLPLENRESKRKALGAAAERKWILAIDHDPEVPLAQVVADGSWFGLTPAG